MLLYINLLLYIIIFLLTLNKSSLSTPLNGELKDFCLDNMCPLKEIKDGKCGLNMRYL